MLEIGLVQQTLPTIYYRYSALGQHGLTQLPVLLQVSVYILEVAGGALHKAHKENTRAKSERSFTLSYFLNYH